MIVMWVTCSSALTRPTILFSLSSESYMTRPFDPLETHPCLDPCQLKDDFHALRMAGHRQVSPAVARRDGRLTVSNNRILRRQRFGSVGQHRSVPEAWKAGTWPDASQDAVPQRCDYLEIVIAK